MQIITTYYHSAKCKVQPPIYIGGLHYCTCILGQVQLHQNCTKIALCTKLKINNLTL